MRDLKINSTLIIATSLFLLQLFTRGSHFGSEFQLPSASLAVFFLAGFYVRSPWFFMILLAGAFGSDYVSITYSGVSDWCVTPAYIMLLPAYACLWFGGHWCAQQKLAGKKLLLLCAGVLAMTTTIAFQFTSGGFYFFSGRYPEPTLAEYGLRIVKYFPSYIGYAFLYSGFVAFMHIVITTVLNRQHNAEQHHKL